MGEFCSAARLQNKQKSLLTKRSMLACDQLDVIADVVSELA
jgi:hypothetical protein